ncbi:bifunctional demethylmenaquinone methyltransferase/2-methoxy-6-polyprenyl-1,4-benzoquinol methylase UbiE [Edaphobacter aggregans]|uniref:bifunctional demethylmenaquinone methyltransferase/2-methoxy-6-polyprenyl-1,4-benzoquinol methylase UbiE n=1 Tax=Edaphobacter aggregans TaxID=570835 RepID=UPI00316ACD5C
MMAEHRARMEHELSTGARPVGATTEEAAAANVQRMFDSIAPKYDLLNHLLSMGLDQWWWARAARTFREVLARPDAAVLDLCCGTGDMTMALMKHRPVGVGEGPVYAVDFSHEMLERGREKFAGKNIVAIEADALHLPMSDSSLDLVVSAFGFRNLANYEEGLAELYRVLAPGGQIGILDCNQPEGVVGALYDLYFKHVLPRVGGMISGDARAYRYLPASVERFPRPKRMLEMIRAAGFGDASWTSYTFGTSGLYRATKP